MKVISRVLFGRAYKLFCLLFCLALASCLKNKDSTGSGPRAKVAIMHLVANVPDLSVSIDGEVLPMSALAYGSVTTFNGNVYLPFPAGGHMLGVATGSTSLLEKTVLFDVNKYYSMFFYDSLKDQQLKTLIVIDDTARIDTVAKARFLNFVPGSDTLITRLVSDTVISTGRTYEGSRSSAATSFPFTIIIKPGVYRLQLRRSNAVIFEEAAYTIQAGKLYSFIAKGIRNGTGDRKESLAIILHN